MFEVTGNLFRVWARCTWAGVTTRNPQNEYMYSIYIYILYYNTYPNVEMNMPIDVIQIGDYRIPPVQCVRDLGVVFDHHMTMHKNITKTCASCYFHLRNISSIRDSLTDDATIQLVHAFVSSRIDYCNSLLYGIPEYAIKKLQRVQNLAARVVTRSSKYSSITPSPSPVPWSPSSSPGPLRHANS